MLLPMAVTFIQTLKTMSPTLRVISIALTAISAIGTIVGNIFKSIKDNSPE